MISISKKLMRLILTRHGETEENIKGIIQGHMPGKLSEEGLIQAKKLAKRLKTSKIDAIYSSDLARASKTAKEIKKYHPKAELILTKDLRERDQGSLSGKNKKEIDWVSHVHDGESPKNMYKRIKRIIIRAYSDYPNGDVVFVAHGAIGRMIINTILNRPIKEWESTESLKNTSISIFEIKEDNNHEIKLLNCIEHLKLPSYEECIKWYKENKTPDNIILHVKKVNKVAIFLAKKLIEKGVKIDYDLVDKASLLHDLDKWLCIKNPELKHGFETEKILIGKGFPRLGKLAKNHLPTEIYNKEISWEEKIIVYADSRVQDDKIVDQDQRIKDALERYNFSKREKEIEIELGRKCEEDIFSLLDIRPKELEIYID
jgi:broad specificity phosphatase PhoE